MPHKLDSHSVRPASIKELFPIANTIAENIHKDKIKTIFVAGADAQSAAYLVKMAWKNNPRLTSQPMPHFFGLGTVKDKIYFMSREELAEQVIYPMVERSMDKLVREKALILDGCVHSGKTLRNVTSALQSIGFTKIKKAALTCFDNKPYVKLDYPALLGSMCPEFNALRREVITAKKMSARTKLNKLRASRKQMRSTAKRFWKK